MNAGLEMLGCSSGIIQLLLDFDSLIDFCGATTLCWGLGTQCGLETDSPLKTLTVPSLSQLLFRKDLKAEIRIQSNLCHGEKRTGNVSSVWKV